MQYDFLTIIKLIAATLLPVLLSGVLFFAEKKTRFGKMQYWKKQTIIGVLFGGVAILGTEFGIPVEGAILNVRNAASLSAGLLFGAPSGVIAGIIGGVYRFAATYWGAGEFSQIACTIGCLLAGLFGAGCRKYMFDDKKPSWAYGLAIGGTTEVLHMLLVFLTNMNDVYGAYKVVAVCSLPMIICNAVSVSLSLLIVSLVGKERLRKPFKSRRISQVFQLFLMICVIAAFSATMIFTSFLQTKIAYANADKLLELNLADVKLDVEKALENGGSVDEEIKDAIRNRHIGQNGGIIVCNDRGIIVYDNGGGHIGESVFTLENAVGVNAQEHVRFTANIGKIESFCMFTLMEGYYHIATVPVSEVMFPREIAVSILAFMEVIVFASLFVHVYFLLKKLIVDNIHRINGSLAQITDGNLNVQVNVRENEEFASLSDDINATVDTLKRYIAEAESRIDRELEFARQIQHSALPSVFPPYPDRKEFGIFASMDAAKEVGGDFYDFWLVDSTHLAFLVADVSGKGIPGALFMMRAKTLIKNLAESGLRIEEAFTQANKELCENNDAEMFVTAWMGMLDTRTGILEYVNAGHNPPLVRHKKGKFEYLRTRPNFILAGMDRTRYKKHELKLEKGDEIFVYTDGVTEAVDIGNNLYGENRLKTILSSSFGTAEELCGIVRADIDQFVKGAEQSDDITMLCVKLNNVEEEEKISVIPDKSSIETVTDFLSATLEKWETPVKLANKAKIAVDEIYSNVVYYSGATTAEIILTKKCERLEIRFEDDGKAYDPTTAKEPDVTLSAEEREIGGLGIFMVKRMAADIDYKYQNGKNVLVLGFVTK
ncbi:MAG: SpoIIE family protein phosphatase [Christensenellales bacterium]